MPLSITLRVGLRILTMLSRAAGPLRYPLADACGAAAYLCQPRRRRQTASNHMRASSSLSPAQARSLARRSYQEYARTTVDFLWAIDLPPDYVRRRVHTTGVERVAAARDAGTGAILVLSHFGNWDMAAQVAGARDWPLTTVMAPFGPPAITNLVAWARRRNHMEVFTPARAARGLLRALGRNRLVALLCDVPREGPTVLVHYCRGPVTFTSVPAWLALHTGAPIFPVDCWRAQDGYHLHVHQAITANEGDDERALMQRVAHVLEPAVLNRPEQWYPFGNVYADHGEFAVSTTETVRLSTAGVNELPRNE